MNLNHSQFADFDYKTHHFITNNFIIITIIEDIIAVREDIIANKEGNLLRIKINYYHMPITNYHKPITKVNIIISSIIIEQCKDFNKIARYTSSFIFYGASFFRMKLLKKKKGFVRRLLLTLNICDRTFNYLFFVHGIVS